MATIMEAYATNLSVDMERKLFELNGLKITINTQAKNTTKSTNFIILLFYIRLFGIFFCIVISYYFVLQSYFLFFDYYNKIKTFFVRGVKKYVEKCDNFAPQ